MNASDKQFSIRTVLGSLRRRKWLLVIPVAILTAAAGYYASRQPERFRAKTTIASDPAGPGFISGRQTATPVIDVQEQLRSIRNTVLSSAALEEIIREFDLYDLSKEAGRTAALEDMKSRVSIQVDSPQLFSIGFEGPQALQVMLVANRLAEVYVERQSVAQGMRETKVDDFLDQEVDGLRRQLHAEEQGLAAFRQSVGQELPERLSNNLRQIETLQDQIQRKTDQIGDIQARRAAVIAEMKTLESEGALRAAPRAKSAAETQLDEMRLRLNQLRARYTVDYPGIGELQEQIRVLEATPAASGPVTGEPTAPQMHYFSLQAELKSIEERLKSYAPEREALAAQMRDLERRIGATPGYEGQLAQRARDLAITRSRYETLYAKHQEARLDQRAELTTAANPLRIVEPAQTPEAPYSPKREQIVLMGLLAGLALGAMGVVFAEMTDTTLRTVEEFQDFSSLPVLASIPRIASRPPRLNGRPPQLQLVPERSQDPAAADAARKHFAKSRLAVVADPHSVAAEQYRILALKIHQRAALQDGTVLAITSSAGGEGKTLTAVNLALELSTSTRERVLLIDGDLRRPRVKDYLNIASEAGFSGLLSDIESDLTPFVKRIGDLDVILGGDTPANPAALLSLHATTLLARLRKEYRWIVVDCPPVVPVADSHILAATADRVLLVVRARRTSRELFQRAVDTLGATNVLGVVLNEMDYGDTSYAYAYRYYQKQHASR